MQKIYLNIIRTFSASAMTSNQKNMSYASLSEDSELLLNFLDKYVKIELIKNCSYKGFVHSIDPVSHSIILSIPDENKYLTAVIPGHAILNVTEEETIAELTPPQRKPKQEGANEDVIKRKNKLIAWFKSNLLPVSEVDNKIKIGDVSLLPPYNVFDLCTENPIVAMEIKKIMERMPEDFVL